MRLVDGWQWEGKLHDKLTLQSQLQRGQAAHAGISNMSRYNVVIMWPLNPDLNGSLAAAGSSGGRGRGMERDGATVTRGFTQQSTLKDVDRSMLCLDPQKTCSNPGATRPALQMNRPLCPVEGPGPAPPRCVTGKRYPLNWLTVPV